MKMYKTALVMLIVVCGIFLSGCADMADAFDYALNDSVRQIDGRYGSGTTRNAAKNYDDPDVFLAEQEQAKKPQARSKASSGSIPSSMVSEEELEKCDFNKNGRIDTVWERPRDPGDLAGRAGDGTGRYSYGEEVEAWRRLKGFGKAVRN